MSSRRLMFAVALALGPTAALADARGQCERQSGDAAIAACSQAMREHPHDARLHSIRGARHYAAGDFDRALADFDKSIELDATNAANYTSRGLVHQARAARQSDAPRSALASMMAAARHLEHALADFSKAIEIDPTYAPAYAARAGIYKANGEFERALADYAKAMEVQPGYALAYVGRGLLYFENDDLDRALADYDSAAERAPHSALVYSGRGKVQFRRGDLDRALADYSKAIALDPTDALSYGDRGIIHKIRGDLDRLLADVDKAIELDPEYAAGYQNRGFVHLANSDFNRALAGYDRAVELGLIHSRVLLERGIANLYAGSVAKALADIREARERHPIDPYVALWLDIVSRRANLESPLAQAIAQVDMTQWPAPVISLFLGQSTPAAVLAAADDPLSHIKAERVCEAHFYGGARALQQGRKDEATRLLRAAVAGCPKALVEWPAARAELRALGVTP